MQKQIAIEKKYLLVPAKTGEKTQTVSFFVDEEKVYEFEVPVSMKAGICSYDFQAVLPVHKWIGKTMVIEGEVPEGFMNAIALSETIPSPAVKKQAVHFRPDTGWMNDPCGLLYDNGVYHLYFQHNPFDIVWGNMSWGHAVSRDLLHWEQLEDAMLPDADGTVFTGSALLNEKGLFGLPKDAQLYIYTSAGSSSRWSKGKKFVQKLAWSTDHGKTLNKMDGCILDHIVGDNRDMNVYWHEGKQLYFAVMFWEKNDYAILNSKDLQNWKITEKLTLPDAWECPDLMEVPVEGGGTKWVFWTADGYYFVGDFDGSVFTTVGIRKEAYHSMLPYAAQSYNGTDRVIMVPWMRTNSDGKLYTGMMGLPRQLTLVEKDGEYVLRQKLVEEFEQVKETILEVCLNAEEKVPECKTAGKETVSLQSSVTYLQQEEAAVEVLLQPAEDAGFTVTIYGTEIFYSDGKLTISEVAGRSNGVKDAVKLGDKEKLTDENQNYRVLELNECPEKVSLISDGEILEVTVNDGMMGDAFETVVDAKVGEICVKSDGNVKMGVYIIR